MDFLADGSTQINVVKPSFGSMQVIAQGVSTVSLNETAKSEWLLLLPNSTNVSSSSIHVIGGVCEVSGMDGSIINATISTVTTNDKMTATFQSDPAFGFEEGANYQILCNISLTQGLFVNGVKNFIYVNPQKTYWQWLIDAIAQLLGIAQQTSATVNETLSISNQTLQLVKAMNSSGISSVGIRAWTTN